MRKVYSAMSPRLPALLFGAACAALPLHAAAQSNYFDLRLGAANLRESGMEATNPRVTSITGITPSSTGTAFSLALGRSYANRWRAEIEFTDRRTAKYTVTSLGNSGGAFSGNNELRVRSWSLMANAWYDLPLTNTVAAYVGGGIGYANNTASGSQTFQNPPNTGAAQFGTTFPNGRTGNFAWSLGAGLSFALSQTVSLEGGYRFTDLGRYNTAIDTVNGDEKFRARLGAHDLQAGLRFKF